MSDLVWSPVLGKATTIFASSKTENIPLIRALAAAIGAGALVVLFTAVLPPVASARRRRRPGRRKRHVLVTGRR